MTGSMIGLERQLTAGATSAAAKSFAGAPSDHNNLTSKAQSSGMNRLGSYAKSKNPPTLSSNESFHERIGQKDAIATTETY